MARFVEFVRRSGNKPIYINPDKVAAFAAYSSDVGEGREPATVIWLAGVPEAKTVRGTVEQVRAKLAAGPAALSGKSDF